MQSTTRVKSQVSKYSELLAKYIDLLKKLDEIVVDRNHTKDSYYKINRLHHELTNENQELELAYGP